MTTLAIICGVLAAVTIALAVIAYKATASSRHYRLLYELEKNPRMKEARAEVETLKEKLRAAQDKVREIEKRAE